MKTKINTYQLHCALGEIGRAVRRLDESGLDELDEFSRDIARIQKRLLEASAVLRDNIVNKLEKEKEGTRWIMKEI